MEGVDGHVHQDRYWPHRWLVDLVGKSFTLHVGRLSIEALGLSTAVPSV